MNATLPNLVFPSCRFTRAVTMPPRKCLVYGFLRYFSNDNGRGFLYRCGGLLREQQGLLLRNQKRLLSWSAKLVYTLQGGFSKAPFQINHDPTRQAQKWKQEASFSLAPRSRESICEDLNVQKASVVVPRDRWRHAEMSRNSESQGAVL